MRHRIEKFSWRHDLTFDGKERWQLYYNGKRQPGCFIVAMATGVVRWAVCLGTDGAYAEESVNESCEGAKPRVIDAFIRHSSFHKD